MVTIVSHDINCCAKRAVVALSAGSLPIDQRAGGRDVTTEVACSAASKAERPRVDTEALLLVAADAITYAEVIPALALRDVGCVVRVAVRCISRLKSSYAHGICTCTACCA